MKSLKAVLATGAAAAALAATTLAGAGTARADTVEQCPQEAVCILVPDQPIMVFYGYGVHTPSNVHGMGWMENNLTGGRVSLCRGPGGVDCEPLLGPGRIFVDFDTIRSFVITP
ncbi:hypothetical protein ACFV4F_33785 [Kitasatospora sp. NPDC059722]|uniref:hypothetical protein n=1 Tax=Kitasatospora sp. NPDC059722 TaxID=3346925 RepID=UPI0036C844AA